MIKLFKILPKVIKWLSILFSQRGFIPTPLLIKLIKDREKSISRGDLFVINYFKAIRSHLSNYLSGNAKKDPLSKCSKDGMPRILGSIIPLEGGEIIRSDLYDLYYTKQYKFTYVRDFPWDKLDYDPL